MLSIVDVLLYLYLKVKRFNDLKYIQVVSMKSTLLHVFESYVNMEPQTLDFSIQSLLGSNPSDYVNLERDFWGTQIPSSIVSLL